MIWAGKMRYVLLPTVWNQHYVFAIFSLWCIRMNHELNKSADPCTFSILTFHVWQMNMMVWRTEDLGNRSPKKKKKFTHRHVTTSLSQWDELENWKCSWSIEHIWLNWMIFYTNQTSLFFSWTSPIKVSFSYKAL